MGKNKAEGEDTKKRRGETLGFRLKGCETQKKDSTLTNSTAITLLVNCV